MSPTGDFAELGQFDLDRASIRSLPREFCERNQIVVLGTVDVASDCPIRIGCVRPLSEQLHDYLHARFNREIEAVQLNEFEIGRALQFAHASAPPEGHEIDLVRLRREPPITPVHLVETLLWDAVRLGASDIHLEAYSDDVDVRYRIDGIMHQAFTHVHADNVAGVLSRLKVLARMDIGERRRPQDGRFRATFTDRDERTVIDFRLSVLPGPEGPDCVIRVLDPEFGLVQLSQLGMSPDDLTVFANIVANPEGLVIVTGPTGCGKTTTLYSSIAKLEDGTRKILTVEDPIEYQIPKISQKQVSAELTMADLMRASMRQDPDVLLFGEIRDPDSAATAMMAAATGHLVLTTLHTADALGSLVRLRTLGVEDYDLSTSILAVVAQRLVRRICADCHAEADVDSALRDRIGPVLDGRTLYAGTGCEACHGTGFRGRTGIFEILIFDEVFQDLVAEGTHTPELREHLARAGFRTLFDDALAKVLAGITTLDELVRVVPFRQMEWARRRMSTPITGLIGD